MAGQGVPAKAFLDQPNPEGASKLSRGSAACSRQKLGGPAASLTAAIELLDGLHRSGEQLPEPLPPDNR
jgi:hypothetical protein